MTPKKTVQTPFIEPSQKNQKPLKMKEWAVERLKQGYSPNRVACDIEKLFGEYVSIMTVYRWKRHYIAASGEDIPAWYKSNKTFEQRAQNKGITNKERRAKK